MGYYTSYTLKVKEGDPGLIEVFREDNTYAPHALYSDGSTSDKCTWYEHEEDLKTFSELHPNTVFELHGISEDGDNIWYKYFKNGKMQVAEATVIFSPYDESKLQ
jgi:hypothetical protein